MLKKMSALSGPIHHQPILYDHPGAGNLPIKAFESGFNLWHTQIINQSGQLQPLWPSTQLRGRRFNVVHVAMTGSSLHPTLYVYVIVCCFPVVCHLWQFLNRNTSCVNLQRMRGVFRSPAQRLHVTTTLPAPHMEGFQSCYAAMGAGSWTLRRLERPSVELTLGKM